MTRILVFDQNHGCLVSVCAFLSGNGYEPVGLGDYEQILERFAQGDIDLFLADVIGQEKLGYYLVREIRDLPGREKFPCILWGTRDLAGTGPMAGAPFLDKSSEHIWADLLKHIEKELEHCEESAAAE